MADLAVSDRIPPPSKTSIGSVLRAFLEQMPAFAWSPEAQHDEELAPAEDQEKLKIKAELQNANNLVDAESDETDDVETDDVETELLQFEERKQHSVEKYETLRRQFPDEASELDITWLYAQEQADKHNFDAAHKSLSRMEGILESLELRQMYIQSVEQIDQVDKRSRVELIKQFLNRTPSPSQRSVDIKAVETSYNTTLELINSAGSPEELATAKNAVDAHLALLRSIEDKLRAEGQAIVNALPTQPSGTEEADWKPIADLCDSIRSLISIEPIHSDHITWAQELASSLPEKMTRLQEFLEIKKSVSSAMDGLPPNLPADLPEAIRNTFQSDESYLGYTSAVDAAYSAELDEASITALRAAAAAATAAFEAVSLAASNRYCLRLFGQARSAIENTRTNLTEPSVKLVMERVRQDPTFNQFLALRQFRISSLDDVQTFLVELPVKKNAVVATINSCAQAERDRLAAIEAEQRERQAAIASYHTRVQNLITQVNTLISSIATFESSVCPLQTINLQLTQQLLSNVRALSNPGDDLESSLDQLAEHERSLQNRQGGFDDDKSAINSVRGSVTEASRYLRSIGLIGRNLKPQIPAEDTVVAKLGPVDKPDLEGVQEWQFTYKALKDEMNESLLDGLMTKADLERLTGKSGTQKYLKRGNYHISVSFSPEKELYRVTSVHVTPESPINGVTPRLWYICNKGSLRPGNPDGEQNPSGYKNLKECRDRERERVCKLLNDYIDAAQVFMTKENCKIFRCRVPAKPPKHSIPPAQSSDG